MTQTKKAATRRDPAVTSRMMAAVRNKDSRAERLLRHELHRRGRRFRLHSNKLVGKPDLVFPSSGVAVFVDGDFWHGNAWRVRGLNRFEDQFPTNREFWVKKIRRNIERDQEVSRALSNAGWSVVRIWESEILQSPTEAADRVERELLKSAENPIHVDALGAK